MQQLETEGFLIISGAVKPEERRAILKAMELAERGLLRTSSANLNDSTDQTNVLYNSARSPGVQYLYLESHLIQKQINTRIRKLLERRTGINWQEGINDRLLPLFKYKAGAYIRPHRGRNIGYGPNNYVAVANLTTPHIDYKQGLFYLNPEATASKDGKTVYNDKPGSRMNFQLQAGEIIVFDNQRFVHGTTPTEPINNKCIRITCSWRTS